MKYFFIFISVMLALAAITLNSCGHYTVTQSEVFDKGYTQTQIEFLNRASTMDTFEMRVDYSADGWSTVDQLLYEDSCYTVRDTAPNLSRSANYDAQIISSYVACKIFAISGMYNKTFAWVPFNGKDLRIPVLTLTHKRSGKDGKFQKHFIKTLPEDESIQVMVEIPEKKPKGFIPGIDCDSGYHDNGSHNTLSEEIGVGN